MCGRRRLSGPSGPSRQDDRIVVRAAEPQDHRAVAEVCRRSGRGEWPPEVFCAHPDRIVVVAVAGDELVGVAKTHWHSDPDGDAPAGHYLGGVVVDPRWRRRGVGNLLTAARLRWVWGLSDRAYYFTNERNEASIALHREFGFTPIAMDPTLRGVSADGSGVNLILYEATRPAEVF